MTDCPHHPALKRPSLTFAHVLRPEEYGAAITTLMLRPEDCVQCAMARIKALRDALNDVIGAASRLLMTQVQPEDRDRARKALASALVVYGADLRSWYDP